MAEADKYDVVVVGSGPGGYVAAIRAAQLGLKTACVEKEKTFGGTCLNIGCIPSKALLESTAHYAFLTRHAKEFGILCESCKVDFSQFMRKKQEAVSASTAGVEYLFKKNRIDSIIGKARFINPTTLEIDQKQRVEAKNIIVATGSEPITLPFLPIDEKTIVTSTGALRLEKIPKEMIVVGGGVIGVELASVYSRLGTKVTVIEMLDQICTPLDPSISRGFLQILQKQGIAFWLKAKVIEAKQTVLKVEHEGQVKEIGADVILVAVGRRPYTQGLDLEKVNIKLNAHGFLPVDKDFRTSVPSIYGIGDVIDGPMLAHRASEEGMAAAEIIAGGKASVDYASIPNVIYTHPEVATVGLSEQEARTAKLDIMIGTCSSRPTPGLDAQGKQKGRSK